jgi:enoyl-CoA hydratase/carnithine racemase
MSAYSTLKVSRDGASGVIEFNRPEKLNAISFALLDELPVAIGELESDGTIRGIILTGSEKSFATGADLSEAVTVDTPQKFMLYNRQWRTATYSMEHCLKPVIAAINGYCLTGGLELAMACDIRLASPTAVFAITSSKIGSVAGAGGTQRLPRLVGRAVAMELLFTARNVDAQEAAAIGLVNRVVATDVVQAAKEMVEVIATRGPLSVTWMKIGVQTGMDIDIESSLDLEAVLSGAAFVSKDKAEGMTAFLEKRDPVFKGE